ncbi:MAG: signal peptidase II [Parvularculaceae bacterium]
MTAALREWLAAARGNPLFPLALAGAGLVAVVDQLSKAWILHGIDLPGRAVPCAREPRLDCPQIHVAPFFDLTYVENRGASFGVLAGGLASRVFLSLLSVVIVGFLVAWLARLRRRLAAGAVALIAGGALGNLYDRVAYGHVVDFLDFSGLGFPWVFNVADAAINVGVGLLLLDAWLYREQTPQAGDEAAAAKGQGGGAL